MTGSNMGHPQLLKGINDEIDEIPSSVSHGTSWHGASAMSKKARPIAVSSKSIGIKINFPVVIDNAVKVEAMGERWFGAGKEIDNFIYLSITEGIGAASLILEDVFKP